MIILVETVLPSYVKDSRELLKRILDQAKEKGEEIPISDAFELYKELIDIRAVHKDALPNTPFAMDVEDLLQEFVWKWVENTDASIVGWVEGAVREDEFNVRTENPDQEPTEDQRHSISVIDIFRSFNQSLEQIKTLNWQNPLQYAKFMTRMSKSVGNGLTRYCELLEQKFAKEMETQTPEQEAAAAVAQTRQQKYWQMAKEAWAAQEKVEPFNFLPEVRYPNISCCCDTHCYSLWSSSTILNTLCCNSTSWSTISMLTRWLTRSRSTSLR